MDGTWEGEKEIRLMFSEHTERKRDDESLESVDFTDKHICGLLACLLGWLVMSEFSLFSAL